MLVAWLVALGTLASSGCAQLQYVKVREVPKSPLSDVLKLDSESGPEASERTRQLLRQYALAERWESDPDGTLESLQNCLQSEPSPELSYAFAELSFLQGKRHEAGNAREALNYYAISVTNSYIYLFDDRFGAMRNPYDPHFRGACDLYNGALECCMRILARQGGLEPGEALSVETANSACEIEIATREATWRPEDFERFEFVSDYEIEGLTNQYRTFGLGVPLIAVRRASERPSPAEKFYPPGLSFPVSAFLRILPGCQVDSSGCSHRKAVLELYDPLAATDVMVGPTRVPIESDLSTPLAYFLQQPGLGQLATLGLVRVDKTQNVRGLYMVAPYESGKIPVVMVHGLWSSPITWMEMFNDLRSQPAIRNKYQFWFYLYPTGQPFWISAAQLREDLAKMRETLDPAHREVALDQMVLVGHSMGGLLAKMQVVNSGDEFWKTASNTPFQLVKASTDLRKTLEATYFFQANPGIRRIITIGTPHRGSDFANPLTQWLSRKLIIFPQMFEENRRQILADNPGLLRDGSTADIATSIDSLSPKSPILPVLLRSPLRPGVLHHNVVGVLEKDGKPVPLAEGGDGVVSYPSAHLENIASEIVVNSDHISIHRHPLSVLEVRRVLLEHAAALPRPPVTNPFQFAQLPQPAMQPPPPLAHPPIVPLPPTGEGFAAPPLSAAAAGSPVARAPRGPVPLAPRQP
ncbi:MAG: hypothetical protein K1X74_16340 [Pirellulales bacterium]|nr:hypothetical protein [Pirellulales bacterium]